MSDSERPSLKTILILWKEEWGKPTVNKSGIENMQIPFSDYQDAFNSLVNTLRKYDYSERQCEMATQQLIQAITPPKSKGLNQWRLIISQIWDRAVTVSFKSAQIAEADEKVEIPKEEKKVREEVSEEDRIEVTTYVIDEDEDILAALNEDKDEPK